MTLNAETGKVQWSAATVRWSGWLHGTPEVLVTGAWRHYNPLQAFDTTTGEQRWIQPLSHVPRRTALYTPLNAVMTLTDGHVVCHSLTDGAVVAELSLPGSLDAPMPDWQFRGAFGMPGQALLERGGGDRLLVVSGAGLSLETRHLCREPLTLRLRDQGGEVFFMDTAGQLCVYNLALGATAVLEPLEHARRDHVPAVRLPDGTVIAGTSAGLLVRFARFGGVLERVCVGKRVLTPLSLMDDALYFGRQSGQIRAWAWDLTSIETKIRLLPFK